MLDLPMRMRALLVTFLLVGAPLSSAHAADDDWLPDATSWFLQTDATADPGSAILLDAVALKFGLTELQGYGLRVRDHLSNDVEYRSMLRLIGEGSTEWGGPYHIYSEDLMGAFLCTPGDPDFSLNPPGGDVYVLAHRAFAFQVAIERGCAPEADLVPQRDLSRQLLDERIEAHPISTPEGLELRGVRAYLGEYDFPAEEREELLELQNDDGSWGDREHMHETVVAMWLLLETGGVEAQARLTERVR